MNAHDGSEVIDVAQWIDRRGMSGLQVAVFVLCFMMASLDGFDAQIIGFVAPAVIRDFHVERHEMASVFAAGLFGLLLGCLLIAPLADWIGRKKVLVASTLAFGVLSVATTQAHSLNGLLWLRFATGLGLGGAMPNGIALISEYVPARRRASLTMAMFVGFPCGATIGGLLAAPLIPLYGWQVVFLIGGVLPILLAGVLAFALPESIRHLAARPFETERIRRILGRIDPVARFTAATRFVTNEEKAPGLPLAHLFRNGRGIGTALIWTVFFMSLLDIFFISSWLPTVLSDAGISVEAAVYATAVVQAGGVVASLVVGPLVDRFGFFVILPPLYLLATAGIAVLGQGGESVGFIMAAAFVSGAGIVGGQTAANVLAAVYYPTAIRATGVGWALGIGRIGSIVGPVIGGLLIQLKWDNKALFLAAALPAFLAAVATMLMAVTNGKRIASQRLSAAIIPE